MNDALARYYHKQHAIQDVRDRYYADYQKLLANMQAEIDQIESDYSAGEYLVSRIAA